MKKEDFIREELNYHLKMAEILSFVILTATLVIVSLPLPVTNENKLIGVVFETFVLGIFVGDEFSKSRKSFKSLMAMNKNDLN